MRNGVVFGISRDLLGILGASLEHALLVMDHKPFFIYVDIYIYSSCSHENLKFQRAHKIFPGMLITLKPKPMKAVSVKICSSTPFRGSP